MLKLLLIALRGVLFIGLSVWLCSRLVSCADSAEPAGKRVQEIRAILAGVPQQIKEHDHRVTGTLKDLTARLERIEAAIVEIKAPIIEPPAEPLRLPAPIVKATQAETILQSYTGAPWHVVGRRGDKQHLIKHMHDHGSADDLQGFSNSQLERIHGAMHTQHHTAAMYTRDPNDSRFRRTRPVQQRAVRTYTTRIQYGSQNCPNGRCPLPRR